MKTLVLLTFILFIFIGCGHIQHKPHKPLSNEELNLLEKNFISALQEGLEKREDITSITNIEVLDSVQKNGKVTFTYRLTYTSTTEGSGRVTNTITSKLTAERLKDGSWQADRAEPQAQEIFFDDPIEIEVNL